MFFRVGDEPANGGLPWDPFKAIVAPRPIGWVTTISPQGEVNLAPYSYFNAVSDRPNIVFFSSVERKDSQRNAELTGAFVYNVATWELREQMNTTSAHVPPEVNEAELAGLELVASELVAPPRVSASPAALECVYLDTYVPHGRDGRPSRSSMVFGEVVGVHLDESLVREGRLDTAAMRPIMRMGYDEYTVAERAFRMTRPDNDILERIAST